MLKFQNQLILWYIFCLTHNLFKFFKRILTLWTLFIKWSMTLKVIQGHKRPPLCLNHSITFVDGPILINKIWLLISWRHNFFIKFYFILIPSDLITTLTYVLIDNFCACLYDYVIVKIMFILVIEWMKNNRLKFYLTIQDFLFI